MLVFVVIQLLSPERAAHLPPEIQKTLEIVEDAFCCFDASEDGYLEPSEVAEVLCTSNTPGRATRALSDKLFAQLDFDGSGGISFKEFLVGLEKMVMEEYADEYEGSDRRDDEEEQRLQQQAKMLAAQQSRKHGGGAKQQALSSRVSGHGGGSTGSPSSGSKRNSMEESRQGSSTDGAQRRDGGGHHVSEHHHRHK